MKRFLSCLLALLSVLGLLTGCRSNQPVPASPANQMEIQPAKYTYHSDAVPLTTDRGTPISELYCLTLDDFSAYYAAHLSDEVSTSQQGIAIFRMELDSKQVTRLPYEPAPAPDNVQSYISIPALLPKADGSLLILELQQIYPAELPENSTVSGYDDPSEIICRLKHLAADGSILKDLPLDLPDGAYPSQLLEQNNILYLTANNAVFVFDEQGVQLDVLDCQKCSVCRLSDDQIGITGWSSLQKSQTLQLIDSETHQLGKELVLPIGTTQPVGGFGDYDYCYLHGGAIFGHNTETDESEKLMSWIQSGVDVSTLNLGTMHILPDGQIAVLRQTYHKHKISHELLLLHQADAAELAQVQELTLAYTIGEEQLIDLVIDFNESHDDIHINLYPIIPSSLDISSHDAVQRFNTELLSGNGPDLLLGDGHNLPLDQFVARGLFLDLWPMIDADPELSRDDLMTHLFDVLSDGDALYQAPRYFQLHTAAITPELVHGEWTFQAMQDAMKTLEPGATVYHEYDTKQLCLYRILSCNIGAFVDWKTGTCNFETPEFTELLHFVNLLPDQFEWGDRTPNDLEGDYSRLKQKQQLMTECWIGRLLNLSEQNLYHGGKAAFVGFPSSTGLHSFFLVSGGVSILSTCRNPEAAWTFVRELLLEKNQLDMNERTSGFPTNRHAFETVIQEEMTPTYYTDKDDVSHEVPKSAVSLGDKLVELYTPGQEIYDAFLSLYEQCDAVECCDETILNLISDEVSAFFAGQKTAEQAAELIQNRVSLYLKEQG